MMYTGKVGRFAAEILSEILQDQKKVITIFNVLKVKCYQPPTFINSEVSLISKVEMNIFSYK